MRIHRMMFCVACALVWTGVHAQSVQDMNSALMSLPSVDNFRASPHVAIQAAPRVSYTASSPADLEIIQSILAQPEDRIDLAQVEIAIERMIDPQVNEMATLHQLDVLAANVRARFPQGDATDPEVKGTVLISTMRDAGSWNDFRPFRYDLNNPLGDKVSDKLISHYLATRLGNCVTMPVLFVILGQKLGLPVTLSTAPMHVFAKFRKDDGTWTNVELTSYGGQTDEHYQQRMGISSSAMDHHIYLQTLTRKQSAQVIMEMLVEHYYETKQAEQQLALTDLLLNANPNDIPVMIFRGDAFAQLSDQRYKRYGSPKNIPAAKRSDYLGLEYNNQATFAHAEALGWTPETPEHKAAYLQWIQQVKAQGAAR
jgi:regulator of sirC expression with transglutaminase-like and TPR domain